MPGAFYLKWYYLVLLVKTFGDQIYLLPTIKLSGKKKKKKEEEEKEPLLMNLKLRLSSIYYLGNVDLNLGV